jgi:hypothetical protein
MLSKAIAAVRFGRRNCAQLVDATVNWKLAASIASAVSAYS